MKKCNHFNVATYQSCNSIFVENPKDRDNGIKELPLMSAFKFKDKYYCHKHLLLEVKQDLILNKKFEPRGLVSDEHVFRYYLLRGES